MDGWLDADRDMDRSVRWLLADLALSGLFVWITIVSVRSAAFVDQNGPIEGAGWLLALGPTLLIPLRRFAPLTTLAVATALYFAIAVTQGDSNAPLAAPLFAYAVGVTRPVSTTAPLVGFCAAALSIATIVGVGSPDALTAVVWFLLLGSGWVVAVSVRRSRHHAEQLDHHVRVLEAHQEEVARAARSEERARIARELHDAVGHAVNVIVLQAGAARFSGDRDQALDTLAQIEQVGRGALTDLDHLLGLLHDTDDDIALAPSRNVSDIVALVDDLRSAGADIAIDDRCDCALDWRTGAAAYRIAQEALTNAVKHAGSHAHIELTMACSPTAFELIVTDDGLGDHAPRSEHGGRGIPGMAERASVLGGHLTAGPRPDGGFVVRTTLPNAPTSAVRRQPFRTGATTP
jgi:signal transduction histidine kinase